MTRSAHPVSEPCSDAANSGIEFTAAKVLHQLHVVCTYIRPPMARTPFVSSISQNKIEPRVTNLELVTKCDLTLAKPVLCPFDRKLSTLCCMYMFVYGKVTPPPRHSQPQVPEAFCWLVLSCEVKKVHPRQRQGWASTAGSKHWK